MTEQEELDHAILGDDELPSDGYDLYKNYREAEQIIERLANEVYRLEFLLGQHGYAHRNGESAPPEVEGNYWVEMNGDMFIETLIRDKDGDLDWIDPHAMMGFVAEYRYYGPIPMPTRKEIPQ